LYKPVGTGNIHTPIVIGIAACSIDVRVYGFTAAELATMMLSITRYSYHSFRTFRITCPLNGFALSVSPVSCLQYRLRRRRRASE
jgi:hypothetical protein